MFDTNSYKIKMSKTIDVFSKELSSLRTEGQIQVCLIWLKSMFTVKNAN